MALQAKKIVLGENITTSTTSAFEIQGGGKYQFIAEATWSAGSAKLQIQSPNGTWIDFPLATLSANGVVQVELPPGQVRMVVATATALYAYLIGIPQ